MALLSNTYSVSHSLTVNLIFEDGTVKKNTITEGDLVTVTYNKDGLRTTVEGIVTRLYPSGTVSCTGICNCVCEDQWSIVIDGSSYGFGASIRIAEGKILDMTIEKTAYGNEAITSPVGDYRVTDLRLVGDVLQLSVDNGVTWLKVVQLPAVEVDVPTADQALATKIAALLPSGLRPDQRASLILSILALVKGTSTSTVTTTTYPLTTEQIAAIVKQVEADTTNASTAITTSTSSVTIS